MISVGFIIFSLAMPQPRLTRRTFYMFLKKQKEWAIISSVSSQKLPQDASRAFVLVRRHHGDERCFYPSWGFQSERTLMKHKKNILALENTKRGKYPFFLFVEKIFHERVLSLR